MDLMLTSFGVSHLQTRQGKNSDIFYRMPPVSLASAGQEFMPDYSALLLADRIIIDQKTYNLLIPDRHREYGKISLMIEALHNEGFVRIEDFDSIIASNRELLEAMLERDLKEIDSWIGPLRESVTEWERLNGGFIGPLSEDFVQGRLKDQGRWVWQGVPGRTAHMLQCIRSYSKHSHYLLREALESSRMRHEAEHRKALREALEVYLSYVNP